MFTKLLTYLAIMAGIVVFALILIFVFANSIALRCVRQADQSITCQINKQFLGRVQVSSRLVRNVTDVQTDEDCSNDSGCAYRAVLVTSQGEAVPVNDVYTDGGPVSGQVAAISNFIHSADQPSFDMRVDTPWWVLILIGGLGVVGLLIVSSLMVRSLLQGGTGSN